MRGSAQLPALQQRDLELIREPPSAAAGPVLVASLHACGARKAMSCPRQTSEPAGKRARVTAPIMNAPAPAPRAPETAGALDRLSDALLVKVFECLGLRTSWPLRAVCRRLRRVIQDAGWPSLEVWGGGRACEEARALLEVGRLRLAAGARVSLRSEIGRQYRAERCSAFHVDPRMQQQMEGAHRATATAFCELLASVASGQTGGAQLRGVEADIGVVSLSMPGLGLLYRACAGPFLVGVLRALWPPGGAPSGLESLAIGSSGGQLKCAREGDWWPPPAELRPALAPFGRLRSLVLAFAHSEEGAGPEFAAAVAASCPLLRALAIRPRAGSADAVLAALAGLARLEQLVVVLRDECVDRTFCSVRHVEANHRSDGHDVTPGVVALADGEAGKSLRRLAFSPTGDLRGLEGIQQKAEPARPAIAVLRADGLRALARMPNLESVVPLRIDWRTAGAPGERSHESVAVLSRLAKLREAAVFCLSAAEFEEGCDDIEARLCAAAGHALSSWPNLSTLHLWWRGRSAGDFGAALGSPTARAAVAHLHLCALAPWGGPAVAAALEGLPSLRSLELELRRMAEGDVLAVLRSPAARRALTTLAISMRRPLSMAEAEAITALPALRSLVVHPMLASNEDMLPIQLLRGLRPRAEVWVEAQHSERPARGFGRNRFARACSEIQRMFLFDHLE
eukprot:tig00000640_g2763.t1